MAIVARVDPGQLQQALTNLVVNGIQATGPAGSVCVRASRCEIDPDRAQGRRSGSYALLEVCDDASPGRKQCNLVVYLAEVVAGELRADDDALEVGFFPIDALPDAIAFENNRAVLQRLRREFQSGEIL